MQRLAALMRQLDLEPTEEDILDVLWLAPRIRQFTAGPVRDEGHSRSSLSPSVTTDVPPPAEDRVSHERHHGTKDVPLGLAGSRREVEPPHSLHLANPVGSGGQQAAAIRAPSAPALGDQLGLARAFRPLKRKRPSRHLLRLDEDATAIRIAEERLWIPALSTPFEN